MMNSAEAMPSKMRSVMRSWCSMSSTRIASTPNSAHVLFSIALQTSAKESSCGIHAHQDERSVLATALPAPSLEVETPEGRDWRLSLGRAAAERVGYALKS